MAAPLPADVLVLGHRGASAAAVENTPAAFALADDMGADGVELDVRRVADGRLLVAHDALPDDLVSVDAMRLATLDAALDACGDRMLVNVEIKNSKGDGGYDPTMAVVPAVIETLRRRGRGSLGRWLISSFSWSTVAACRELAPDIATGCLTMAPIDRPTIGRLAAVGHAALHPWDLLVDDELVGACHDAGLAVNTWTCNEPERLVALAATGIDGVCTDVPDVALAALGRGARSEEKATVVDVGSIGDVSPRWGTRVARRRERD